MKHICLLAAMIGLIQAVHSQSFFHNTEQYGLHSTLLGGAVTSGNGDLSMAYYNPAALHLAISEADFSLIKPQFNTFSFNNYFGEEFDKLDTDVDLSPSLASFKIKLKDEFNLVLITIEKNSWENALNSQNVDVTTSSRQEQIFKYNFKGRDRWLGAGISFPLSNRLSVGVSHFFSFAKYRYYYKLLNLTDDSVIGQRRDYFSNEVRAALSNNFSSITKVGLHLRFPQHNLGVVVKTPNYFIVSKNGEYESTITDIGLGEPEVKTINDLAVKPTIKTPWELSIGYAYTLKRGTKFWLNFAYYSAVSEYSMATIGSIEERMYNWNSHSESVSNYSIGISEKLSRNFEIIASFRSNLFAYTNQSTKEDEVRLFILDHDRHHASLGANFKYKKNSILLGVDWGFSSLPNDELFAGFSDIDRLITNSSSFTYNSISVLLTYGFLLDGLRGKK